MTVQQQSHSVPPLVELVRSWTETDGDTLKYGATRDLLTFLSRELYGDYQPFQDGPLFLDRLADWLDNLRGDTHGQQLLFEFVPWLLFIGKQELDTMYRAAFTGPISRWIIDDAGLDIADPMLPEKFSAALRKTYFGHMAGMDIGSFCRINNLHGQSLRPGFRELSILGDFDRFQDELRDGRYTRVVAVEDMVGTGTQMIEACPILSHVSNVQVLLCPIVVSQRGIDTWHEELEPSNGHMRFSPLFRVPRNAILPEDPRGYVENPIAIQMRALINSTWSSVQGDTRHPDLEDGPFGFGKYGSLVVSYLNCPDNVPPLVHYNGGQWRPLFPRVSREG